MSSSAARRLLDLGERVAQRDRAAAEPAEQVVAAPVVDENAVKRQTVDLHGRRHRALGRWKTETAVRLDVPAAQVSTQAVLEELVDALLEDEHTARVVRRGLERHGGASRPITPPAGSR